MQGMLDGIVCLCQSSVCVRSWYHHLPFIGCVVIIVLFVLFFVEFVRTTIESLPRKQTAPLKWRIAQFAHSLRMTQATYAHVCMCIRIYVWDGCVFTCICMCIYVHIPLKCVCQDAYTFSAITGGFTITIHITIMHIVSEL